jgi:HSP20 family molecular chaperone IbpA
MSNKILWCAIALLSVACAAQTYYIHSHGNAEAVRPAADDLIKQQDQWIAEARKHMLGGAPVPFQKFDDLFNDDFFGRRFDPFAEIETFQKRMAPLLSDDQRSVFGQSWTDWLHDRMDLAEIHSENKKTDKEVIVSFKIPGLAGESLNVDVNDDRIRIAYDAKTVEEKKGAQGAYHNESVRHFEKIMPVPEDADPKTHHVVHEGNIIKIVFERRQRQSGKA